jgi:hypothetical protein
VALVLGAAAAWITATIATAIGPNKTASDYDQVWNAARAILRGAEPYAAAAAAYEWGTFYPPPTFLIALPLSLIPIELARALFAGLGTGLLAFAVTRRHWWPLAIFVSGAYWNALLLNQWSPVLTAAVLLGGLSAVLIAKPTIGLALWIAYPSRTAAIAGVFLLAASFAILPDWPWRWHAAIQRGTHLLAPVQRPFGWLLLLAWLRWKRPEARLLGTLALLPQTLFWNELLPLVVLVPRSFRQMTLLVLASLWGFGLSWALVDSSSLAERLTLYWPFILAFGYLPPLALILLRRNEGSAPAWAVSLWNRAAPSVRKLPGGRRARRSVAEPIDGALHPGGHRSDVGAQQHHGERRQVET